MSQVIMYTTNTCPYCLAAERLLHSKGVEHIDFIRVDLDFQKRTEMIEKTGRRTVPQIYVGDYHVGGFDDLQDLEHSGKLKQLLEIN
ncbi:MAG: glutaredoxin 3 [Methylotenera sp.]|nr:glutaredoxin 3 [Methylotenera sp.]